MKTELKIILMMLALLWPGVSQAGKEYPFWQLVAKSYLIVEGSIKVPVAAIRKTEQNGDHDYVEIKVAVSKTLKGIPESQDINFRYYTDTEQYGGVSRKKIIPLNGKSTIVFLQNVREKYYLAAYVPEALQSAGATLAARVKQGSLSPGSAGSGKRQLCRRTRSAQGVGSAEPGGVDGG